MKKICILLLIISASCAGSKKHKSISGTKIKKGLIEMSKSVCFGKCPAYSISINEKGEVNYEGERNVDKMGKFTKQLSQSQTDSLFMDFINADFWSFEDEYTSMATDLPTTYISFTLNDRSKKIKDYIGAPEKLKALEKSVEQIANSPDNWKMVEKEN